jgi:hypothetical protein
MLSDIISSAGLKTDDNGYYYQKYVENEGGNNVLTKIYVPKDVMDLYTYILDNFEPIRGSGLDGYSENAGLTFGHLLSYIADLFGQFGLISNTMSIPGDINEDKEVNVGDINRFYDYIQDVLEGNTKQKVVSKGLHHVRICLDIADLMPLFKTEEGEEDKTIKDLSPYLFIVTVHAAVLGNYSEIGTVECGMIDTNDHITGVAYNGKPLYDAAVKYASSYGDSCDNNDQRGFIDYLLRYYGFIFALKCGDLCQAQYYWENYLNGGSFAKPVTYNRCGCHGAYR